MPLNFNDLKPKSQLLAALLLALAAPAGAAGDADFAEALRGITRSGGASVPVPALPALPLKAAASPEAAIAAQFDEWLAVYNGFLAGSALDTAGMSREITAGLAAGRYNGVILGETHGVQAEFDAGITLTKDILRAHGIGAFSREHNLFPDDGFLGAAGVPVLTMKNQFKPEPDVNAGLGAARGRLLVTYTGHVHTAVKLKNYFVFTLLEGRPFGYSPGGKDMPTVEEAFIKAGKRPVIAAMLSEERVLRRVEQLFLRKFIPADGAVPAEFLQNLRLLRGLWAEKVEAAPQGPGPIYFVRSPEQDNLFAGLTPGDRRPLAVGAVLEALDNAEFLAWAGADRLRMVEALWASDDGGVFYRVVARKFSGEIFERTVKPAPRP
jgi:hypothetical protein